MTKIKFLECLYYKQVVACSGQRQCASALCVSGLRRGRAGYMLAPGRPAAAPERPWDPSASFQLWSCARVGSPRIKRRSVTPNRANKWQMLWISLSSVTTEGLKGPRDCFHMKAASQQNHGKLLPTLQTGWNGDVWSFHIYTTKIQTGIQRQALKGLSVSHMVRLNWHWR